MNAPLQSVVADRSRFLGGSDAAAVMGLSPWSTPVELWREKTGRKPKSPPDPMQAKRYARGHKLEPFIRDMVIDKLTALGITVELLACNARYVDPFHSFLSCEIDFELRLTGVLEVNGEEVLFSGEHVNCDAKSVSGFARRKWGDENTEDVPIEYAAQFMHGLGITGRRFCLVAALRSFDDVDIYWTLRDDETIAAMRAKCVAFWTEHVLTDRAPDPLVFDDIKALFPLDNGESVEATEDIAEKVARFRQVKQSIRVLEEEEEELKFQIADFISPNTRLTFEGFDLMTWKGQNDTRLSQALLAEAELYRVDPGSGEFVRIPDPVSEFTRTKVVRVLRFVTAKKGKK